MNNEKIKAKTIAACQTQRNSRGIIILIDVLIDVGVLTKQNYENWRFGKVNYLERVCTCNLKKLSLIMHEVRSYAAKNGLKPSITYYKRWGAKRKMPLRFSKSGKPFIEKSYATHYIDRQYFNKKDTSGNS